MENLKGFMYPATVRREKNTIFFDQKQPFAT